MKKLIALSLILFCLVACDFMTGKKKTVTDPETGKKTTTYEKAPIEDWVKLIGVALPGLAIAGAATARIATNAARARDGLMDANERAIEDADWSKINTNESAKILLNVAQRSHKDSKLLSDTFEKWNIKRKRKIRKAKGL